MFLASACKQVERAAPPAISAAALDALRRHAWPGNVRELRNVVERASALCVGDTILPEHLPPSLLGAAGRPRAPVAPVPGGSADVSSRAAGRPSGVQDRAGELSVGVRAVEKARITEALERWAGNQSQAARELGISRGTLIARMEEFGMPRPRRRDGEPNGG